MQVDCFDDTDESSCDYYRTRNTDLDPQPDPPVVINLDGRGYFTSQPLLDDRCPETHFQCPGEDVYCMPVYLRCNTVPDCLGKEDENGCDDVTCPGYYRCRGSRVCLHPHHVCDGWPQCPERDDELLCDVICPETCLCQGLAFVCRQSFNTSQHLDLRYLDVSHSSMTSSHLHNLTYLIYLKMSQCGLDTWSNPHLPNLQHLDLSHNLFTHLPVSSFSVPNVRHINLHNNPITTIYANTFNTPFEKLIFLDLSKSKIGLLDSSDILVFPDLQTFNLSFTDLIEIAGKGFSNLKLLKNLDLRSEKLSLFPRSVVQGLTELVQVQAVNYKLCCKETLPEGFNIDNCLAPHNEVSSCQDLLRSVFYRLCLWLICLMSVIGNCGSLVYKMVTQRGDLLRLGYNVFVSSLCLSDLFMGLYLTFIGGTDLYNRG